MYEPDDDSFLLSEEVKKYAKGNILDIGTGSGIQAYSATKNSNVKNITAVDIDKDSIIYCKEKYKDTKIKFVVSDLFSNIKKQKFDTIIFNPPYLPEDKGIKDAALYGGKKGYEVIEIFFDDANEYLKSDGTILLLFSSFTNKDKVEEIISENLMKFEELSKKHIFFEDLFVYKISKRQILRDIEKKGIGFIKYLTKGHRGLLFTGNYKGKKVGIKIKNPKSEAVGRIENEINWLKRLNKKKIGPKFLFSSEGFFAYEFAEGIMIKDFLKKSSKEEIKKVLKEIFLQLYEIDKIGVDKEEMHHPYKHIIIGKEITLIDFERCNYSVNPKNVTQFLMFLRNNSCYDLLKQKGFNYKKEVLTAIAKEYKEAYDFSILKKTGLF